MVGVMLPLLSLPAGKGPVCVGFRCRLLWSPLCFLYIDATRTFSYGRDFSDQEELSCYAEVSSTDLWHVPGMWAVDFNLCCFIKWLFVLG